MPAFDNAFWDHAVLQPSPALLDLPIGGTALLFDELSQQLFEQNETSAAIWDAIRRTGTVAGAARSLVDDPGDQMLVLGHVRAAASEWLRIGFLRPVLLSGDNEESTSVRFGWQGQTLEVRLYGDLAADGLTRVFQPFVTRNAPDRGLAIKAIGGVIFTLDDRGACTAHDHQALIPEVKGKFTNTIVAQTRPGFLLHAALLSREGKGVLICGEPGAGKSTLSVSLILAGFTYHSDDAVWVGDRGELVGVPFAPALKEGSWPLVAEMACDLPTSAPCLRGDGQRVCYILDQAQSAEPVDLQAIVLLEKGRATQARMESASHTEALQTILGSAFAADGAIAAPTLRALVRQIGSVRAVRLYAGAWRENRHLIEELFK